MRIGSPSVSRWQHWVRAAENTSTLSVAKARSINPGKQSRNSRVSSVPVPMATASGHFSTIASNLVCVVMVLAEDVIFSGFKFRRRFEWRRNLRFWVGSNGVFCKKTGKILTVRGLLKNGRKTCVHRGCFRKNSVNFYDF